MRTFYLNRIKDISGISGTGKIAQGIEFDNGKVAMTWLTDTSSTVVYDRIEDVETIHGHSGATEVVFDKSCEDYLADELSLFNESNAIVEGEDA